MYMIHISITHSLRQYRRRADAGFTGIAAHDGASGVRAETGKVRQAIAVHQKIGAADREGKNGPAHGQKRCLQNVQRIDFRRIGPAHSVRHAAASDLNRQSEAGARIQGLGITNAANPVSARQDDGGRDHRARQRASPRFIQAGNHGAVACARRARTNARIA